MRVELESVNEGIYTIEVNVNSEQKKQDNFHKLV
ncbi:hypothetical protein J2S07_002826 [Robertmurraya andreesenii]|uniref:Uncharacterized protein n=1 Tax=Anoxybacillus andreesenii TaxID=1325932 RepID=A0ABT9V6D4_9BACL|nr:hypothetical protein [Robertmurraya andreesenii]